MKTTILKKLFTLLCLCCLTAACSDDEESKSIVLTNGTQTSQTVYADETTGNSGGIHFTAAADWTATVTAVISKAEGGSTVDWLSLSAYSGGPGEYTLTLTLTENTTGQDRKAQIEIRCGADVIIITVEQKGTTEEGDTPEEPVAPAGKRLSRVEYTHVSSENPDSYDKHIMTFEYDNEGRLAVFHQISYTGDEQGYYADDVCTFTYEPGQMKIVYEEDGYSDPRTYIAKLNEAGDVSLFYEEPEYSTTTAAWMFKYDADGYLQQILEDYMYEVDVDEGGGDNDDESVAPDPGYGRGSAATRSFDSEMLSLTWQNGNLVSTIDDEWREGNLMDWDYTSYTNDTPGLDFNVLGARILFGYLDATYSDLANMLFALRMLGQNSKNLVKADLVNWAYESGMQEPQPGEPAPPEPTTSTSHHDEWAPYDYTFTAENYLQRVTARCTLQAVTTEIATGEVLEEKVSYYDDEYVFTYE